MQSKLRFNSRFALHLFEFIDLPSTGIITVLERLCSEFFSSFCVFLLITSSAPYRLAVVQQEYLIYFNRMHGFSQSDWKIMILTIMMIFFSQDYSEISFSTLYRACTLKREAVQMVKFHLTFGFQ